MNIFSKNFFDQQHPTSRNIISHNKTSHNNISQKVSCAILATSLTAAPFFLPFFSPLRAIASPLNLQESNSQNTNQKFAQLSED